MTSQSHIPDDRYYSKEHEWARHDGERVIVGITHYAQEQLGDVVFVGLPEPGTELTAGESFGEVESTKSVSDVYSPVSGVVLAKNDSVEANPELVNSDPYGEGWLVTIEAEAGALEGLLSADEYAALIGAEG